MRDTVLLLSALVALAACGPRGPRAGSPPKERAAKAAAPKAAETKPPAPKAPVPSAIEFRLAEDMRATGTQSMRLKATRETVHVYRPAVLTAQDIESASVRQGLWLGAGHTVTVFFTAGGAQKIEKATSANVGKRLAILVKGQPVAALTIQAPIVGGRVDVELPEPEANQLVGEINGALRK